MNLSPAQLQALKTWINGNMPNGGDQEIANALNAVASPDYWVWRTAVEKKEIVQNVSQDATSFVWAGNGFIGRSAGELACWDQLFNSTLTCNPSLANVRQAFADIFSGAGNAAANRAHLLIVARRKATVAEQLFQVSGDGSTAVPAVIGAEGEVTAQNVVDALNS